MTNNKPTEGKNSLMTHLVGGYPDWETWRQTLQLMSDLGVEYTEVQLPFSDPIADGPTITQANYAAIAAGVTVEQVFAELAALRGQLQQKVLIMTYYNLIHKMGVGEFVRACEDAGVWGVIVPDMPLDEEPHEQFWAGCAQGQLAVVPVVSPMTTSQRLQQVAAMRPALVYGMSRTGITGRETQFGAAFGQYIARVRAALPAARLAVGFGVQTPADVQAVTAVADTAVVGSAVLRRLQGGGVAAVEAYLTELLTAGKP